MSDLSSLTVPVAGWYPDRNDATAVRWWDGGQWTEHTRSIAPEQNVAQPVSATAFGFTPVEPNPLSASTVPVAGSAPRQVAPGWYPDYADGSIQRWWDGTQWTAHTAQNVANPPASNTTATLAMIFSLVSFAGVIFAPLLFLALAGIVAGIVALRRVRLYAPNGGRRGQAIAGVVVGAVSLVATILLLIAAVGVYQQVHSTVGSQAGTNQTQPQSGTGTITFPSTIADLKVKIAESISRQNDSIAVRTVTCDGAASMVSGSVFQCGVIVDDGRSGVVGVQIGRPAGTGKAFGMSFGPLTTNASAPSPTAQTVYGIQQALTVDLAQAWDTPLTSIVCDPGASTALGSRFRCGLTLANGQAGVLMVTIVNPGGFDVTVVQPPESPSGSSGSDDSDDPDVSRS